MVLSASFAGLATYPWIREATNWKGTNPMTLPTVSEGNCASHGSGPQTGKLSINEMLAAIEQLPEIVAPYTALEPITALPFDGKLGFPGWTVPGTCRARIYANSGGTVVLEQNYEDPGGCISDFVEDLAATVWEALGRPVDVAVIEHYPSRGPAGDPSSFRESFSLVTFAREGDKFVRPSWLTISRSDAEGACGSPV